MGTLVTSKKWERDAHYSQRLHHRLMDTSKLQAGPQSEHRHHKKAEALNISVEDYIRS